jgi:hypothetical protein
MDQKVQSSGLFLSAALGFLIGGIGVLLVGGIEHVQLGIVLSVVAGAFATIGGVLAGSGR